MSYSSNPTIPLSARGQRFVDSLQLREDAVRSPEIIEAAFQKIGMHTPPRLLEFQMNYGGMVFNVGNDPVCFGILHGDQVMGTFSNPEKKVHELIHFPPDENHAQDLFLCADSLYQEQVTLDTEGRFYEEGELAANRIEDKIEDWAVYGELMMKGFTKSIHVYFQNLDLNLPKIIWDLELSDHPDFPRDLIYWGSNEKIALRVGHDSITLISPEEISTDHQNYINELVKQKR